MIFALFLAIVLVFLAIFSIRHQLMNWRRLGRSLHLPSDDRSYLRSQVYRRLLISLLLLTLAGFLGGAYFSGIEEHADQLGQRKAADVNGERPPPAPEEKDFLRMWTAYWVTVLILLFVVLSLATIDLWSTRRYAWQQLRRIQIENRAMLERDLALYRQQKLNDRMHGA